ncbi:MAG: TonB-dependent receptor [Campylobacterales bacterium]|nr:TonB-dependent receptor [Campylobacterales bacterium]
MRKTILTISLAASAALADSYTLEEISAVGRADKENINVKTIDKETIEKRIGAGQTNPYKALDMLPSVQTGQADTYGLVSEDNPLRIRGGLASTFNNFALTVDGVPSVVIVQKAALGNLVDMENVEAMDLTVGASSADSGLGFGNATGSLDMRIKKASNVASVYLKQSLGSENFGRTFIRADSGKLFNSNTKFFVSASDSKADKWKGIGDAKRQNLEFGTSSTFGENVSLDTFFAYNHIEKHDYRALSIQEATDLDKNYDLDFSNNRTSAFYYNYNKQDFEGYMAQMNLESKLFGGKLSIKPYYITTNGEKYSFNTSNTSLVTKVEIEQEQYGAVAKYDRKILTADTSIGYWYQSIESSPPPLLQKTYKIVNGQLVINSSNTGQTAGYGMINSVDNRESNSPFLVVRKKIDDFKIEVGLRYVDFKLPSIQGYTLAYTAGDYGYDDALSKATKDPNMYVAPKHFRAWLPSISAKYSINPNTDVFAGYARGMSTPDQGPLWQIYKQNYTTKLKGVSFQQFWDKAKAETSDQYNLGMKYKTSKYSIEPTLYYATYENKQVSAYDSDVQLSYKQNIADVEAKGVELLATYMPVEAIELFLSASYNNMKLTNNIKSGGSTVLNTESKQAPDAPEKMLKAGATFRYGDFYAMPTIKYMDERYGDAENKERIAPYSVVDVSFGYTKKNKSGTFKEIAASLDLQNVLGRKYISLIQASDDTTSGTNYQYVTGAPFAAIATVALKF